MTPIILTLGSWLCPNFLAYICPLAQYLQSMLSPCIPFSIMNQSPRGKRKPLSRIPIAEATGGKHKQSDVMKKDGTIQGVIGAGIVFYWVGSPWWPYLSALNDPDRYCGTMGCYDIFFVPFIFLFVLFCTFISFLFCRFLGRIYYENRMSSAKYSSAWGPERAECPHCTNKSLSLIHIWRCRRAI